MIRRSVGWTDVDLFYRQYTITVLPLTPFVVTDGLLIGQMCGGRRKNTAVRLIKYIFV